MQNVFELVMTDKFSDDQNIVQAKSTVWDSGSGSPSTERAPRERSSDEPKGITSAPRMNEEETTAFLATLGL